MNLLASIRQRQTPWAGRALGLFVVVWLNMALQPCSMAFGGTNEHDCSHCPPAHSGEVFSHNAHETDDSAPDNPRAETSASHCASFDEFNHDSRTVKVRYAQSDVPLAIVTTIAFIPVENASTTLSSFCDRAYWPGDPPSINVLYGVYLI